MAASPEALLRKSLSRTGCTIFFVGGGTSLFGVFLVALHALRLDPSVRHMPMAGVVLLYVFALGMIGLGGLMVLSAVFRNASNNRELMRRLTNDRSLIAKVERTEIRTTVGGQTAKVTHGIDFTGTDGRVWKVMVAAADVEPILAWANAAPTEASSKT